MSNKKNNIKKYVILFPIFGAFLVTQQVLAFVPSRGMPDVIQCTDSSQADPTTKFLIPKEYSNSTETIYYVSNDFIVAGLGFSNTTGLTAVYSGLPFSDSCDVSTLSDIPTEDLLYYTDVVATTTASGTINDTLETVILIIACLAFFLFIVS